jgi:hypothetical protein
MYKYDPQIFRLFILDTLKGCGSEAPRIPALVEKCMKSLESMQLEVEQGKYIKRLLKHETLVLIDAGTLLFDDDYCLRVTP